MDTVLWILLVLVAFLAGLFVATLVAEVRVGRTLSRVESVVRSLREDVRRVARDHPLSEAEMNAQIINDLIG